jgi:hypothetical protein
VERKRPKKIPVGEHTRFYGTTQNTEAYSEIYDEDDYEEEGS